MLAALHDCVHAHEVALGWLGVISALMFVGSLLAVPWFVVHIPTDYFVRRQHFVNRWRPRHPLLRVLLLTLKNLGGVVLVLAGVAMLVLPGQGILTILIGLMFLDFPGKLRLERRLAAQPAVTRAINWMRAKAHRPPLELPQTDTS